MKNDMRVQMNSEQFIVLISKLQVLETSQLLKK